MRVRLIAAITLGLLLLPALLLAQREREMPDKVLSSRKIEGMIVGFEVGDYSHVSIKTGKGTRSFFVGGGQDVTYFLVAHWKQSVSLTVQNVETYIEVAAKRLKIDRISTVRQGKLTSSAWWAEQRRHASDRKLIEKYQARLIALAAGRG